MSSNNNREQEEQEDFESDDDYYTEEARIEELLDHEFDVLQSQLTPSRNTDAIRFDLDIAQNLSDEEDEDQEGDDYSKIELDEEQVQFFFRAGVLAYQKTCKNFDFFMYPFKTVTQKLTTPEVSLVHHGLGDKGCIAIAQCIKANPLITSLDLSDNGISIEGVDKLMHVLQRNMSITELNLTKNRLGHKGLYKKEKSFGSIARNMLSKNTRLKTLILKENKLSDSDVQDICQALCENNSLLHIDLSYNDLGERSGAFLYQMMSANVELKVLHLSWNKLTTLGGVHIANGLRSNNVIHTVSIDWNGIGEGAAQRFGLMFQQNVGLEHFSASNNRLTYGNAACKLLTSGIKENTSLKSLNLAHNPMDEADVKLFVDTIQKSESCIIESLNLQGCLETQDQQLIDSFYEALKLKKSLKDVKL